LIHTTDWLPTFYSLAGGYDGYWPKHDGLDQWPSLLNGSSSQRVEMLYNVRGKDKFGDGGTAIRLAEMKLIKGHHVEKDVNIGWVREEEVTGVRRKRYEKKQKPESQRPEGVIINHWLVIRVLSKIVNGKVCSAVQSDCRSQ